MNAFFESYHSPFISKFFSTSTSKVNTATIFSVTALNEAFFEARFYQENNIKNRIGFKGEDLEISGEMSSFIYMNDFLLGGTKRVKVQYKLFSFIINVLLAISKKC